MAPRVQLDKAAWSWVEDVTPEDVGEEHVVLAYRVNTPACRRGVCRRNCRGNPNCLVGIGEQLWLGEIDACAGDPDWERRDENAFVGLTNLGATCYVNAFLQVWFHNLELRRSLYRCQSAGAQEQNDDDDGLVYEPQSISEHLQYLFALLQNSNRRYIDPSGLVKALGLDTGLQQDAQEFSKLFLTLLEDSLAKQTDPGLQKVIQKQFCGEFSYVTVCDRCGRVSPLTSTFYELELNIQGLRNLGECVSEFLREERLDGDNRYFCESCQGKQSATRRINLHSLPPILNLQLMRFVFDRQTGHKKKINSYITFPELLDMGPFLEGKEDQKCLYELSTVLIHLGVTAYSGHYIAYVKDARSGEWYKFNDEEIEKVEGKTLRLGIEEDLTSQSQQTRRPRCNKGYHSSRNSYMLVYKVREDRNAAEPSRADAEVPAFLQRLVDRDNRKFEEQCAKMADKRKQNMDKWKEVKELYELLPVAYGQAYEFIPVDWLKTWLDESAETTEVSNSLFLCPHGKLHPDKVCEAKRVSLPAARALYDRYGGGPRLDASSLCERCVVECCRVLQLKNRLQDDYHEVSRLVKCTPSGEGFWVGRKSLRDWRLLALKQLEEEEEDERETKRDGDGRATDGHGARHAGGKEYGPRLPEGDDDDHEEETRTSFNEDVLCGHGTLSTLTGERRLVSPDAWSTLRAYFPGAPEFSERQQACSQCCRLEHEEKTTASKQKSQLINLFKEKNRPRLAAWPRGTDVLYVIPLCFADEWRKFVRKPTKSPPVSSVDNVPLLCPHGGFMFTYHSLARGDAQHIALLWPSEWEAVTRLFTVDLTISIHRSRATRAAPPQYCTRPELCRECSEGFLVQRQRDRREYAQATVYVRKVQMTRQEEEEEAAAATASESGAAEQNGSSSDVEEEEEGGDSPKRDESPKKAGGAEDAGFREDMVKRLKLDNGTTSVVPGVPTRPASHVAANNNNINNNNNNNNIAIKTPRRSTRNRKRAEEKALTVSANQTLKELKIQIMAAFSVAPFDQNLTVNGQRLTDDLATLGSLGITPNSTIVLTADEPVADYAAMDDVYQVGMPEEGFKGTGLLGY